MRSRLFAQVFGLRITKGINQLRARNDIVHVWYVKQEVLKFAGVVFTVVSVLQINCHCDFPLILSILHVIMKQYVFFHKCRQLNL